MPTRNVVLTADQEKMIDRLVRSGRYQNASEVLRQGLRLVQEREADYQARLKIIRAEMQKGIDAFQAGDFVELEGTDAIKAYLKSIREEARARRRS